jgi:hypothetical protein
MHVLIYVTIIFTRVWSANAVPYALCTNNRKKDKYMCELCIYNIHLVTTEIVS